MITFNFVNIAWVFFRAKDWGDAVKVLSGMVGLNGVYFTPKHEKYLSFLTEYNFVYFGEITKHIGDGSKVLNWILFALIFIFLKNSNSFLNKKMNIWFIIFAAGIFIYAIDKSLVSSSQVFLYYNF